jgi:5-methyltetrahydropteroyltriglutamate--homocysteine methyltransferase
VTAEESVPASPSLLPTTVVGSYPQPDWLIDRRLLSADVPRIRRPELWRVSPLFLGEAQDDAASLAIRDMERAGIDVITDGEVRRESYSNHFATALEGLDADRPATITSRAGVTIAVPRVVSKIRRIRAVEVDAVAFLRRSTTRRIKATLPGPFTMSQQVVDEVYRDPEVLAMDFAAAVNEEAHALQAAGADVIQLDEPWLRNDPVGAERYAVDAINRALDGITATTVIHLCFGYAAVAPRNKPSGYPFLTRLAATVADAISIEAAQPNVDLGVLADLSAKGIVLGVLDLGDPTVESADEVADRIRHGLRYVAPDRLTPAPDCGMKYLRRDVAFGKLLALAGGARTVRAELG